MKKPNAKAATSPKVLSLAELAQVTGGVTCKNPETGEEIVVRGLGCPDGWTKV